MILPVPQKYVMPWHAIEVYFHTSSLIHSIIQGRRFVPDHPNTDHPNTREAYTTAITNAISSGPGVVSKETHQFSKTIIYL